MPATDTLQARLDACRASLPDFNTPAVAALNASAPDLLVALKMILMEVSGGIRPYSSDSYLPEEFHDVALAAIAKAEGRT